MCLFFPFKLSSRYGTRPLGLYLLVYIFNFIHTTSCFVSLLSGEDVELNVLDDILGETTHDEFAAELDKASKGKLLLLFFVFSVS